MDTLYKTQFPIEPWLVKMTTALDVIHDAGLRTLEVHRAASEEASRAADQPQLEAMQQELLDISRDGDAPPEVMHLLSSHTKISGWRVHLQYENGYISLKDVIEGSRHDDVVKVIKTKRGRYS